MEDRREPSDELLFFNGSIGRSWGFSSCLESLFLHIVYNHAKFTQELWSYVVVKSLWLWTSLSTVFWLCAASRAVFFCLLPSGWMPERSWMSWYKMNQHCGDICGHWKKPGSSMTLLTMWSWNGLWTSEIHHVPYNQKDFPRPSILQGDHNPSLLRGLWLVNFHRIHEAHPIFLLEDEKLSPEGCTLLFLTAPYNWKNPHKQWVPIHH